MHYLLEMSTEKVMMILLFGGGLSIGGVVAIVAIISHYVTTFRTAEQENALKMEMVQRGIAADEIARVLNARKMEDAEYFKQWLVEKGVEGHDISKIMNAGWFDRLMK